MVDPQPRPNQSTTLTRKSIPVIIRPESQDDINDLIYITHYPAGRKFREALSRLARKYHFSERDYKRSRISLQLDFAAFNKAQQQQEKKNSEGI